MYESITFLFCFAIMIWIVSLFFKTIVTIVSTTWRCTCWTSDCWWREMEMQSNSWFKTQNNFKIIINFFFSPTTGVYIRKRWHCNIVCYLWDAATSWRLVVDGRSGQATAQAAKSLFNCDKIYFFFHCFNSFDNRLDKKQHDCVARQLMPNDNVNWTPNANLNRFVFYFRIENLNLNFFLSL